MRRGLLPFLTLAIGLTLVATTLPAADQPEAKTGTNPNEYLPGPFHPHNVTGEHKGKAHCLVCEFGLNPTALVFAREPSDTLTKLIKKLDTAVGEDQNKYLRGGIVFLSDEKTAAEDAKLTDWAKGANLQHVLVGVMPAAGPQAYGIDKDSEVVVLLYSRMRVVKNYTFKKDKLTDQDVDAITAEFAKLSPKRK